MYVVQEGNFSMWD